MQVLQSLCIRLGSFVFGTFDRDRTADFCERQEREFFELLDKGIGEEFYILNNYISNKAKSVIQLLLSLVGKNVDSVETPLAQIKEDDGWISLEDFANGFNKNWSSPRIQGRDMNVNGIIASHVNR